MEQNNDIYENLFAARIVYQNSFENELDIIKELKIYLLESGFSLSDINQIIYNFYQNNNIQISQETIDNISITTFPIINNLVDENYNILDILNSLIINLNNNEFNIENNNDSDNVVITVDNNDYEKLNSKILTLDHGSKCCICMSDMIKNEKVILLNCDHTFHYECITQYLKEYNYKCPICRAEVGKPKYNL